MRLCRAGTHRARPDGARCRRGGGIDSRPSARGHPTWGTSMTVTSVDDLKIKIFADGADLDGMKAMAAKPWIKGLTTNPTLMRKAGITDYAAFARRVLDAIPAKPISFEVFAADAGAMPAQGRALGGCGPNAHVRLQVTANAGRTTGAPTA